MLETRALVIDDDRAMVEMLGLSLRTMIRRVDQETDGRRAIELFAAHKHSVVVLDLEMPQISGLEIMRRMRLLESRTQVIIVTGVADKDRAIEALNLHAFGLLEKPILLPQLHRLVVDAFAHYQGHDAGSSEEAEIESLYRKVSELANALQRAPEAPELQAAYRQALARLRSVQAREAEVASRAFRDSLALKSGVGYSSIEAARRVLDRDKDSA
ncbi:MAG TPA: response regulator [Kofleriaceae bacterium]|jgi:DNA-binding NtrC family response regulator|nr:response regulator [Kofleriaceae bacterium]